MSESEPMRVSISSRDLIHLLVIFGPLMVIYGTVSTVRRRIFDHLPNHFSEKSLICIRTSVSGISTDTSQRLTLPDFDPDQKVYLHFFAEKSAISKI